MLRDMYSGCLFLITDATDKWLRDWHCEATAVKVIIKMKTSLGLNQGEFEGSFIVEVCCSMNFGLGISG